MSADPEPTGDAGNAIALLEWARRRGFRIGPILEVGTVKMQIVDLQQARGEVDPRGTEPTLEEIHGIAGSPAEGTIG